MRMSIITIAGAALLAAGPALAQDNAAANNMADTTLNATDNSAMAAPVTTNEVTTTTMNTTTTEPAATPVPVDANGNAVPQEPAKKGFPWGVVGLLGLLGLIPRMRRS